MGDESAMSLDPKRFPNLARLDAVGDAWGVVIAFAEHKGMRDPKGEACAYFEVDAAALEAERRDLLSIVQDMARAREAMPASTPIVEFADPAVAVLSPQERARLREEAGRREQAAHNADVGRHRARLLRALHAAIPVGRWTVHASRCGRYADAWGRRGRRSPVLYHVEIRPPHAGPSGELRPGIAVFLPRWFHRFYAPDAHVVTNSCGRFVDLETTGRLLEALCLP